MASLSIPALIGAFAFLGLGVLVSLNRPWTGASFGYMLFALGTVWWQGWVAVLFNTSDPYWSNIIARVCYSGIIFLPITYFHYTMEFITPGKHRRLIGWQYAIGGFFLLLLWSTDWLIDGYRVFSWGLHPKAGPFHPIFLTYVWIVVARVIYLPYRELKKQKDDSLRASQLRFMFWINVTYSLAGIEFIVNYGVPMYPIGVVFTLISSCAMTVAITKYSLFDVKSGLRQTCVLAVSAILLSLPAVVIILLTKSLLVGYVLVLMAFLLGPNLHGKLSPILSTAVDRLPMFKARHENLARIKDQEVYLQRAQTIDEFCHYLNRAVLEVIHSQSAETLLFDNHTKNIVNPLENKTFSLSLDSPFIRVMGKNFLLIRELLNGTVPATQVDAIQTQMKSLGVEVAIPLFDANGGMVAIVCSGPKTTGFFNELDMATFWHLARVAEENLRALLARESIIQKERLAAIGEMASVVSHELKTPLAVIQNSSSYLENRLAALPHSENFLKHVGIITGQTESLNRLITGILDHTRSRELHVASVDLNMLVTQLLELVPIPKPIDLHKEMCPDVLECGVDPDEVRQALTNLINNAVESMPQGGVLTVGTIRRKGWALIFVKDTGFGIKKEDLSRIFDPFFTTKNTGTGLGLAVVKKIVDRHKGTLEIQSEPRKGSLFTMAFPEKTIRQSTFSPIRPN